MAAADLTAARLRELVSYDPETGIFTRLVKSARAPIGTKVTSIGPDGYVGTTLDGYRYRFHRVAWLYMTGAWPVHQIDHINGVRDDNRWSNLREATAAENLQNKRRASRRNRLGLLGVAQSYVGGKYLANSFSASISVPIPGKKGRGKILYLGTFRTPELAHAAYLEAKRRLHSHCTI